VAGNRIKGITVEIGGDTQGLDKALKGVNDTSRDLSKELRDVQKLLKFDPNNAELLAQKQKLLNDQIENSTKKLEQLKDAEQDVQKQFEQGDIGVEQYRAFQREIQDTESYLRNTQNALQDMQDEQQESAKRTQEMKRLFEVTGTQLEDFADVIGTRTVRAIQQGTASSRDLEKAFERIARESIGTSTDIGEVRQALNRLEQGESSIRNVRRELQRMGDDADDTKGKVKDLGGELGGLVAGAGAGMGLGAMFEKAMDISNLDTTIEISMDIPEESKKAVKDSVKLVGSYIEDNETALAGVRKQFQLGADLTDAQNQKIVQGAGTIAKAYAEVDFNELIQESFEMSKNMGLTQEQALGMTKSLLDIGFPPEQMDIISEYGTQLSRAGYTAEEIQGIFASGIETGSWNIDNLMDGLKEGRIVLAEFGTEVPKAMKESLAGTDISAKQVQEWGKALNEGGEKGKQAMMDVAIALAGVKDETKRNELGTQMFGTLWEEQGSKITDTIIGAKDNVGDLAENQRQLNEDTANLDSSPQQQLNQALQELWTTMQPLFTKITEFVTKIAEWIEQNPTLTATILAIVSAIGILMGIFMVIAPIITAMIGLAGTLSVGIGAIATPVLIVIGVIALLIAIGIALYKNWDEIMAWGKDLMKSISESFEKMKENVAKFMGNLWEDVKDIWGNVMDFFEEIDLVQTGKDIIQGLIDGLWSMAENVWESAKDIASGIGDKVANILQLGSPSKLLMSMGEDTGEGMAIGLKKSLGKVKDMATQMGKIATPNMEEMKMKNEMNNVPSGKSLTVNLHSPKALDVRDASREFNRTLNKMSLMW
jgi:phage-related minor tail protein